MPIITAIKPQKRSNKFNVFLDGQFSFSLNQEVLAKLNLKEGQIISSSEIEKIIKENEFSLIFEKVLHFLSFRPRSGKEILDYLKRKKIGEETQKMIFEKLKNLNIINDKAFGQWWLEQRTFVKPKGRILLKKELQAKGLSTEEVQEILKTRTVEEELQLAQKIVSQKLSKLKNISEIDKKRKLYNALLSRGFSWEIVTEVVDKLFKKE